MKYMLLMNATKADFESYASWSPQDLQANVAFMRDFTRELQDAGVFVSNEGLGFPQQAKRVHAGAAGEPVTDGVFPETKEFLAGYWIIDVDNPEEAYRFAARAASGPAPAGQAGPMTIEVRQVMAGHADYGL